MVASIVATGDKYVCRSAKLFAASLSLALFALAACGGVRPAARPRPAASAAAATPEVPVKPYAGKMAYVVVALCDNVNQGIVPVPAALGNGDDPARNLYWGARFGVKTFFRASRDWQLLSARPDPGPHVLERVVFKHRRQDAYLVADAYRGAEIRQATADFLEAASGNSRQTVTVGADTYGLSRGAASHLVAYVGHDGLMDFKLTRLPKKADDAARDAVVLACASKPYFAEAMREAGARPLLWTTNLMAPEAYVLGAALDGWLNDETGEQVRERAAEAYNSYQKCGIRAARGLFATGW
ncbi:MAG TPA: hypothetical protein VK422_23010 [Pyrinomonadaceae bacterium]|nr:hypothetical protein [Pyrinomonadaceae bacterium]